MSDTFALEYLFDRVSAQFAADGVKAVNVFGWREPFKYPDEVDSSTDRIAWVPGNPAGKLGRIAQPSGPGGVPRKLATLFELFTCTIEAADLSDPENERAQYRAARLLFDAWYEAARRAAYGILTIVDDEWVNTSLERRYGAAIRVVCTIEAAILEGSASRALKMPPTYARLQVVELDNTEILDTRDSATITVGGEPLTYEGEPITYPEVA